MRKMKDSGIEWIGKIPEHWNVTKVKYLGDLQSGDNITSEDINGDGLYPVYGGNGYRGCYDKYTNDGEYVLIGRQGALAGNVHLVTGKFWATDHALVFYSNGKSENKYAYYGFLSMNLNQYAFETAAQPGLAATKILNLQFILSPIPEQKAIAKYLDEKCSLIDSLISEKESLVSELEEYKKSLIFECVTGKKEVA
jgi:type I restriction enzyme S subunit